MSTLLNKGVYTLPDAARLLGKPSGWLRRVLKGYEVQHDGRTTEMGPVFERDFTGDDTVSFFDLIELAFIRDFRNEGVSLQLIRRAAAIAKSEWNESHPFCVRRFETDGRRIFVTAAKHDGSTHMHDIITRQQVFERVVRPFMKQLEFSETGALLRWFPMGPKGKVVIDPRVSFGAPHLVDRHVSVRSVAAAFKAGNTEDEIAVWFHLKKSEVTAALQFADAKKLRAA